MDTTPLVRTSPLLSFALIALLSLLTACGDEKANEADNWSLMLSDLPDCHPDSVLRGSYPTWVRPRRRMILAGGRLLSQGLMWPLGVV